MFGWNLCMSSSDMNTLQRCITRVTMLKHFEVVLEHSGMYAPGCCSVLCSCPAGWRR